MIRSVLLATLALTLLLIGCAGGGKTSNPLPEGPSGSLVVSILWPEVTRLIPRAANSIRVEILQGNQTVADVVIARPTSGNTTTTQIDVLPVGELRAIATSYPSLGGDGVPQARGQIPFQTEAGKVATVALTMATTIVKLEILPLNPRVQIDSRLQLSAVGVDRDGRYVLTAPSTMTWSNSDSDIFLSGGGEVLGRRAGRASVRVADSETGLAVTREVQCVKIPIKEIRLSGNDGCILTGDTFHVSAVAYDNSGTAVSPSLSEWIWSLATGSVGNLSGSGPGISFSSSSQGSADIGVLLRSDKYEEAAAIWRLLVQARQVNATLNVSNSGNSPIEVSFSGGSGTITAGSSQSFSFSLDIGSSTGGTIELSSDERDAAVSISLSLSGGEGVDGSDVIVFSGGGRSTSFSLSDQSASASFSLAADNPCG